MKYGQLPIVVGKYEPRVREMMFYQYLPIKLSSSGNLPSHNLEERLAVYDELIGGACCDFVGTFGLDRFVDSYVYLTAKRLFVSPDYNMNREGWHSDGFMTNDINYIWSDCVPTVFNKSDFDLTQNDKLSLAQMEEQALPQNNVVYPDKSLLRLDQFVIHKCGEITKGTMRTFVKISISTDAYDLDGNSINYRLDYSWKHNMRKRELDRNIPQNVN